MTIETQKIWSLYTIVNLINKKIYIGQTVEPTKRWYQHRRDAINPKYPLHNAINKYGIENFEFIIIASCTNQDDANFSEEELIKQYDSLVKNDKGYNISLGGMAAPRSDEWKQSMKIWHASLSVEERAIISKKQSEATIKQIEIKGHPAQDRIVTQETRKLLRKTRLENPIEYTDEIRKHMSEAHIGIKDTEETKQKKSESAKEAWAKRANYDGIKCHAPGCDIEGKHKYKIINEIRYCNKHGLRMLRNGSLESVR